MHKKFEVNWAKIKGGCHSYTKSAPQQSWSDLTMCVHNKALGLVFLIRHLVRSFLDLMRKEISDIYNECNTVLHMTIEDFMISTKLDNRQGQASVSPFCPFFCEVTFELSKK